MGFVKSLFLLNVSVTILAMSALRLENQRGTMDINGVETPIPMPVRTP